MRVEFENIDTQCLRELGVFPISGFKDLQAAVRLGYCELYENPNLQNLRYYVNPRRYGDEVLCKGVRDGYNLLKKIEIARFEDLTKEDFQEFWGYGGKSICKLLWLQRYLMGDESPPYIPEKDDLYKNQLFECALKEKDEKIIKLNEKINSLSKKVKELKSENERLQAEAKSLERERKKLQKIKTQLLELMN